MTPKEKAKELVNKFDLLLPCEGTTTAQTPNECALIAVDEIFYELNSIEYTSEVAIKISYWQEVKQEIEKL